MKRACIAFTAVFATAVAALLTGQSATVSSVATAAESVPSYEQWQADVKQVMDPAIPWLQNRAAQGGNKLAIVSDIDNTALETEYHPGKANKPVFDAVKWGKDHGYAILFVTARTSASSARTDVQKAGYPVDGVCVRKSGETLAQGKQRCRKDLTAQGYTITANIGNRPTDFEGGVYEKQFKLPDYDGQLS
ncbi:hypothetical protein D5S17_34330 [Pseudonocardiaceae bacterium YIM PH 21723]|nr:hypothetical protein D5S17_34330 [Pseudonocardiaceae bacterium YIM PH 21723]